MALANFPRIVGLREGRVIFDAARAKVSADMIAALYRNEQAEAAFPAVHETPERLAVGACF
jgi:phosphonate transport system ATP-binding protein